MASIKVFVRGPDTALPSRGMWWLCHMGQVYPGNGIWAPLELASHLPGDSSAETPESPQMGEEEARAAAGLSGQQGPDSLGISVC